MSLIDGPFIRVTLARHISHKHTFHRHLTGCASHRRASHGRTFHRVCILMGASLMSVSLIDVYQLSSLELLEMQWFLQRLVGMCGAAGWPSLDLDDDDRRWLAYSGLYRLQCVHNSLKRARELAPPPPPRVISGQLVAEVAAGITPATSTATPGPSMIECL